MSIWGTILGGSKILEKGFDLIDKIHTSDQEKIEANSEAVVARIIAKSNAKTELMKSYSGFKVAQRCLAILFCATYVIAFGVATYLLTKTSGGIQLTDFVMLMEQFKLGWIVLTIVGFYFGGGMVEGVMNSRKK